MGQRSPRRPGHAPGLPNPGVQRQGAVQSPSCSVGRHLLQPEAVLQVAGQTTSGREDQCPRQACLQQCCLEAFIVLAGHRQQPVNY